MKSIFKTMSILLVFYIFHYGSLFAQTLTPEFELQLYFEDAAGNKDTVTIGYDINATDSIDSEFGEINTIDEDWSEDEFQVMITNKMAELWYYYPGEPFKVKRRIVENTCSTFWETIIFIDFKNPEFPITIGYDNELFNQNECIKWSVIGSQHPDMLWDLESYQSNMYYTNGSLVLYNDWDNPDVWPEHFKYQDIDGETIYSLWIVFHNHYVNSSVGLGLHQPQSLNIYPNPFYESFEIEDIAEIKDIKMFNLIGKEVYYELIGNKIIPLTDESGIYLLSFYKDGQWFNSKIVKL